MQKGVGARALGMGMAFVAVSDDANAVYWNPAGLALISGKEVSSMTTEMFDVKYNNLGYAQNLLGGGFGIFWLNADSGGIEGYDINMNPTGTFSYKADAYYLSYGRKVRKDFYAGLSLKYINQKLYDTSGNGYGFDLGLLYKHNDNLTIGLNLQDITKTKITWDKSEEVSGSQGAEDKIPVNIKLGVAYKIEVGGQKTEDREKNLTLAVDMDKGKNRDAIYHLGVEYLVNENIALRVGSDDGFLSSGIGIRLKGWQIDYSFNKHTLDNTNRVSVGYRFDKL